MGKKIVSINVLRTDSPASVTVTLVRPGFFRMIALPERIRFAMPIIFSNLFPAPHRIFSHMTAHPIDLENRRRPFLAAVALVLVMVTVLLAAGCLGETRSGNSSGVIFNQTELPVTVTPPIPQDKYVFIEHSINTNGEMVSGDCCGGAVFGDPPEFLFDRKKGVLEFHRYYSNKILNESMMMFYGGWGGLSGCAGNGEVEWGLPVYSLPFTPYYPDREKNVTIESISVDGTVSLRYNQEQITLKPKETWSVNTTRYENEKFNTTSRTGETILKSCTKKLVTTDKFYNAGILDKGTIVFK